MKSSKAMHFVNQIKAKTEELPGLDKENEKLTVYNFCKLMGLKVT